MSKVDDGNKPKRPKRRTQTAGEKEALRLKRLREEFGNSAIDPDEPELSSGLPCAALACAFKDAQQIHAKPTKRFNPKALVKRTAAICPLTEEQKKELERWLRWLNDRRYVTREGYQSPVLQWLLSAPPMPSNWPGDNEGVWRAKVDAEYARRSAATEATSQKKAPDTREGSETIGARYTASTAERGGVASGSVARSVDGTVARNADPQACGETELPTFAADEPDRPQEKGEQFIGDLRRPELPLYPFRKGQIVANNFFEALDRGSDADLVANAKKLSQNADATRAVMSRCAQSKHCIEAIFNQTGLPLPEANS